MEPTFDPPPPPDIVARRGIDADTLRLLDAAQGQQVQIHIPGEVVVDVDGIPIAVEPSTVTAGSLAGFTISRAELAATGLTEKEVPSVRIAD
ncbi:MAG: hypothetical protein QG597_1902 [Actinomycetota bacterium]|nr:hypothetical protein [Actinomycetota bacterium]